MRETGALIPAINLLVRCGSGELPYDVVAKKACRHRYVSRVDAFNDYNNEFPGLRENRVTKFRASKRLW
jgi:hypothetical protein